ncbi:GNAT family N-acetyltransferase [Psychroserpens sp. SPM9]|uniref:GNAT family N-acetyltransferase n=1 Tax=Psychroserpens sp. SPM9 TaxID=2975598 RepID=UPI0021A29011|nr:GNAT family N-acetyltransferase [Psychroserpens sp. SPM9]MDG5491912.1 GNAT family N-acetyltransferase [Psychroserpens sp. SPM9]
MSYLLTGEETKRLHFRIVSKDDFESWMPLFKEENVAKFLGMPEGLTQVEQCEFWFDKVFHRYENKLGGMNALIDKHSGAFIGQCGLLIQTVEDEERLEIGYSILPEYWGKGYAQEAAIHCKEFCFKHKLYDNLISMMHVDNIGSEIVAIKNGMTFEKQVDEFKVFSITRSTWLKSKL